MTCRRQKETPMTELEGLMNERRSIMRRFALAKTAKDRLVWLSELEKLWMKAALNLDAETRAFIEAELSKSWT
jgi:hypothetical protein